MCCYFGSWMKNVSFPTAFKAFPSSNVWSCGLSCIFLAKVQHSKERCSSRWQQWTWIIWEIFPFNQHTLYGFTGTEPCISLMYKNQGLTQDAHAVWLLTGWQYCARNLKLISVQALIFPLCNVIDKNKKKHLTHKAPYSSAILAIRTRKEKGYNTIKHLILLINYG